MMLSALLIGQRRRSRKGLLDVLPHHQRGEFLACRNEFGVVRLALGGQGRDLPSRRQDRGWWRQRVLQHSRGRALRCPSCAGLRHQLSSCLTAHPLECGGEQRRVWRLTL